jgi:hypothetical protein
MTFLKFWRTRRKSNPSQTRSLNINLLHHLVRNGLTICNASRSTASLTQLTASTVPRGHLILSVVHALTGRSWVHMSGPRGLDAGSDLSQRPSWILWHEGFSEWIYGTLALHEHCEYYASGYRPIDRDLLIFMALTLPSNVALRGVRVGTINSLVPYPFF